MTSDYNAAQDLGVRGGLGVNSSSNDKEQKVKEKKSSHSGHSYSLLKKDMGKLADSARAGNLNRSIFLGAKIYLQVVTAPQVNLAKAIGRAIPLDLKGAASTGRQASVPKENSSGVEEKPKRSVVFDEAKNKTHHFNAQEEAARNQLNQVVQDIDTLLENKGSLALSVANQLLQESDEDTGEVDQLLHDIDTLFEDKGLSGNKGVKKNDVDVKALHDKVDDLFADLMSKPANTDSSKLNQLTNIKSLKEMDEIL